MKGRAARSVPQVKFGARLDQQPHHSGLALLRGNVPAQEPDRGTVRGWGGRTAQQARHSIQHSRQGAAYTPSTGPLDAQQPLDARLPARPPAPCSAPDPQRRLVPLRQGDGKLQVLSLHTPLTIRVLAGVPARTAGREQPPPLKFRCCAPVIAAPALPCCRPFCRSACECGC